MVALRVGLSSMRHSLTPRFRALVVKAARLVGSQKALAEQLGCSQQLISFLCTRATEISAEDALGIHWATGGKVPASALRPDLWRCPEHVPGWRPGLPAWRATSARQGNRQEGEGEG